MWRKEFIMNVNKIVLLAKAQVLAILITAKQFSDYDYVGVVDKAEKLKHDVCVNGLNIVGKQQSFVNKHGISKIMKDNKLFEKLVSYGLVINSGGLYQHDGKNYFLPLHIMVNRRRTLGCHIEITDAQNYIELAHDASRVNKFLAEYGLPKSVVEIHGSDIHRISAITGGIREPKYVNKGCDGHNITIEFSGGFRCKKSDRYDNKFKFFKNNSVLVPNDNSGNRFRLVEHFGKHRSSIYIEKYVMGMIMGLTNEFPIIDWYDDGWKDIDANVMTGTAAMDTAEKITGKKFPFIDFNCIEPVPKNLNSIHAQHIETVSDIVNWGFRFYDLNNKYGGRAVVSFSAYDAVISALCDEYKANKNMDIAHKLFLYMVSCCNIHVIK